MVIFSLVQRPIRFLDIYRFNVALSRVRQTLSMLIDRKENRIASQNMKWDGSLIAEDLLKLAGDV